LLASLSKLGIKGGQAIYQLAKSPKQGLKLAETLTALFKANPCDSGNCVQVARDTLKAFKEAGIEGQIVKITDSGLVERAKLGYDAFLVDDAGRIISNTNYHEAVKVGDRFFDALTGPNGATWDEYVKLWNKAHKDYLTFTPK
jgi:hypothetical protein